MPLHCYNGADNTRVNYRPDAYLCSRIINKIKKKGMNFSKSIVEGKRFIVSMSKIVTNAK